MGRSQRHMLWEQGATAAGEIHAQGVVAPGIAMQVDPEALNVLKAGPPLYNEGLELKQPREEGGVEVPIGEPGGPLSGSSLTGAIPESVVPPEPEPPEPPEPGPDPEPGMEPILDSLDPAHAVIGGPDLTMHVHGQNFTDTTLIIFNGGVENTGFVSNTELTTIVKPSLAGAAVEVPVNVRQGTYDSNAVNFNFSVAEPPPEGGRTFPEGPHTINLVEDHADGIAVTLADGAVQVGDAVTIEATGNTAINGSYTVLSVEGMVVVVDNNTELLTPIEAKGRLTVTAGA